MLIGKIKMDAHNFVHGRTDALINDRHLSKDENVKILIHPYLLPHDE